MIIDRDFLTHWKTQLLVAALKDASAPLLLIRLWGHCEARKSDTFEMMPPAVLAAVCGFEGRPTVLDKALLAGPWIEREGTAVRVLGWSERNRNLISAWSNGKKGGRPRSPSPRLPLEFANPPTANGQPTGNPPVSAEEPTANPRRTNKSRVDERRGEYPLSSPGGGPEAEGVSAASPLEETAAFLCCELFGRKKTALSFQAAMEMAQFASELPLTPEKKALLKWFKELPDDPSDFGLKRPESAEGWAKNLLGLLERAEAHRKKIGAPLPQKKGAAAVPAAEPPGCREWFARQYPEAPWPGSWLAVPESVRSEYELKLRRTV